MSIWEMPIPPLWWWLLVGSFIILFAFFWKRTLSNMEEEYETSSIEQEEQREITKLKISELLAWALMPIGLIIYGYGIMNSSHFLVFLVASCLVIVSYVVGTHYRSKRLECQKGTEKRALE